jgi:hypothetical protein
VQAWGNISKRGQELLIKERDLALVIVDLQGNWLYRSSNIANLRSLYGVNEERKKEDLENIHAILDDIWFQKLREFYSQILFANAAGATPKSLGIVLEGVNKIEHVTIAQQSWFRAIVGSEIKSLDASARNALLLDPEYGKGFVDSLAIAETQRNEQLKSLEHSASNQLVAIKLSEVDIDVSEHRSGAGPLNFSVGIVNGKKCLEWTMPSGRVFYRVNKVTADLSPSGLTHAQIANAVKSDAASVFLGVHGSSKVYELVW